MSPRPAARSRTAPATEPVRTRRRSPARSWRAHDHPRPSPAASSHPSWSATVLGMSYTPSMGVTTSAGSSGTTTSPSTKRPPGRSRSATRANRSALPAPSRWCTASADTTRSKLPSGSGSSRRPTRRSAPRRPRRPQRPASRRSRRCRPARPPDGASSTRRASRPCRPRARAPARPAGRPSRRRPRPGTRRTRAPPRGSCRGTSPGRSGTAHLDRRPSGAVWPVTVGDRRRLPTAEDGGGVRHVVVRHDPFEDDHVARRCDAVRGGRIAWTGDAGPSRPVATLARIPPRFPGPTASTTPPPRVWIRPGGRARRR